MCAVLLTLCGLTGFTVLCDVCCVVNPMWTDWPHITVMCAVLLTLCGLTGLTSL